MSETGVTQNGRVEFERPPKHLTFLFMACVASTQSIDAQTKCGCVITSRDNRVLGTGYNGFPPDIRDYDLPNTRPGKYDWVQANHSERNALRNCKIRPEQVGGGVAYVTGTCCWDCINDLYAGHVREVWELEGFNDPVMVDQKMLDLREELIDRAEGKLVVKKVHIDEFKNCGEILAMLEKLELYNNHADLKSAKQIFTDLVK